MPDGSFLFARFADRGKLAGVEEVLNNMSSVTRWDAIDGYFGLAVKFGDRQEGEVQKVRSLEGLTEAVESPVLAEKADDTFDPELCQAYVLVEIDPGRIEMTASAIEGYDETLNCFRTDGRFSLVVILQAPSFDEIDGVIDERISTLDGVLRLKEARIINSYVR